MEEIKNEALESPQEEKQKEKVFSFEEGTFTKKNIIITSIILVLGLVITIVTGITYQKFKKYQTWFDTSNVTYIDHLGNYSPKLTGVAAGTEIYVIAGPDADVSADGIGDIRDHPSMLILGGTHPNEPSGQLTATLFLENIEVTGNTVLFIITETNKSAYTYSYPQEASPMYYSLTTKTGNTRTFKFGTRATNNTDQWPNPDIYVTALGNKLSSSDTRNLNRSYPGVINGTYSERIAYGITEMVKKHDIKVVIDLHEASPEYVTINAVVYHQEASSVAGTISNMSDYIPISLNVSPTNLHGLTHREIGDATNALVFLAETSNASQGKIRGAFKESLITYEETDKFYEKAKELTESGNKILYGYPVEISERVARHTFTILEIISAYNLNVRKNRNFFTSVTDEARRQFLKDCGQITVNLPLLSQIPAGEQATYQDYDYGVFESECMRTVYDVIKDYGLGYFLSDEQ